MAGVALMAKNRKAKKQDWPLLIAALFCEKTLVEHDHVTSLIRVIDTITVTTGEGITKGEIVELPYTFLVNIRRGNYAERDLDLRVHVVNPSGKRGRAGQWSVELSEGPEGGANVALHGVRVKWDKEGVYFYEVVVGRKILARSPFRIKLKKPDVPA
jgi:hypothetical protein